MIKLIELKELENLLEYFKGKVKTDALFTRVCNMKRIVANEINEIEGKTVNDKQKQQNKENNNESNPFTR